jgi:tetratricopeptide (TPR) repeat protein
MGPFSQSYALSYSGWVANLDGRYRDALDLHERTLEISRTYGFAFWAATSTCHAAINRARLSEPEAGAETLAAGIAQWRALGAEAFVPCLQTDLAAIRLGLGQLDDALHEVDQAIASAEERDERFFVAESHRVRGAILRQRDDSEAGDVRRELETSRRIAADQGALVFELRALTDLAQLGDREPSAADVEDLARLLARFPAVRRPIADVTRAQVILSGSVESAN